MSIKVLSDVWSFSKATGTDLLVLLALADMANEDGECWPSMSTIGKKSRLTPRNARHRIRALEDIGEVRVIYGAGRSSSKGGLRSNRYRITVHMDDESDTDASDLIAESQTRSPATASSGPDTVASDLQTRSPATSPIRSPATAESSVESSVEPSFARQTVDTLFDALLSECAMNVNELAKVSRGKVKTAAKELHGFGATPAEITKRARRYRVKYTVPLSAPALANHWASLGPDLSERKTPVNSRRRQALADVSAYRLSGEDQLATELQVEIDAGVYGESTGPAHPDPSW